MTEQCTCYLVDGEHVIRVEVISACPMHGHPPLLPQPRTFAVRYGLPRYQVRQHLKLNGIDFTEERRHGCKTPPTGNPGDEWQCPECGVEWIATDPNDDDETIVWERADGGEDNRWDRESTFTVSVTDLQWEAINRAVEQAGI